MLKLNNLLKKIVKKLKDYPNLKSIVLFGSHAREEAHSDSDIDLLIVLNVVKPINELNKILKIIRSVDKAAKINVQLTNLTDKNYSLYQNVMREGLVLYGNFDLGVKELKLKPYRVINYDLTNLEPKIKVMVSKRVNGTIIKTNTGKIYEYKGLKSEAGVIVLPNSSLLLPETISRGFVEFLERYNVNYKQFKVWRE